MGAINQVGKGMKVVVIGCGMMGAAHIRTLASLGAAAIGVDHNPQRGAPHTSLDTAMNSGWPDAVMICTPTVTHAAVAQQLKDGGYGGPLFVEKALCAVPDEAAVFAEWDNPTTMVGYMLRFDPALRAIRDMQIQGGTLAVHYDTTEWTVSKYSMWRWLECSHDLDLALWLGAPAIFEHFYGALVSEDKQWKVTVTAGKSPFSREWRLRGIDNEVRIASGAARLEQVVDDGGGFGRWMAHPMYRDMLAEFLRAAQDGSETSVPFEDGIKVVDVLYQAGLHNVNDDSKLEA